MIKSIKLKKKRLFKLKKVLSQTSGFLSLSSKIKLNSFKHNKIFLTHNGKLFSVLRQKSKNNQKYSYKYYKSVSSYYDNNLFDYINLYTKFINLIFKEGKKSFWEKSLASLFFLLKKKLNYSRNFILLKIFLRLHTKVELRVVKSRKRINLIPFFIKLKRRCFLSLKWLLESVKKNKTKNSFQKNLLLEILFVLRKKSCLSLNLLEENNLLSYKNRANMHFRW
jgi:ribosomal protein S7